MQAEIRMKQMKIRMPQMPENPQKPGERLGTHSPSQPQKEAALAGTLTLDFQPPGLGDNQHPVWKPLSLWDFVTAAPANAYRFVLGDVEAVIQQKNVLG